MSDQTQQLQQNVASVVDPTNPISQIVGFNPFQFSVPDVSQYIKDAFESLKPYYSKLYDEAKGDVNLAITRLKEDYASGVRYANEDFTTSAQYEKGTLENALSSLGITTHAETLKKLDDLNRRGIAVTQGTGPALNVATEGQAGSEMGQLSQDQQLRKEALQRTSQRNLELLGITKTRALEKEQKDLTRSTEDQVRQLQKTGQGLEQSMEQRATDMAQLKQQQATSAQSAGTTASQQQATATGATTAPSVDPNSAASIKAAFPGYTGWNNEQAIIGDYKATGGAGKQ